MHRFDDRIKTRESQVKCVVWDLDNTVWDGVLSEGDDVTLRPGVRETIIALDARGILNSIASRNEHAAAISALERLDVASFFVAPKINWGNKSSSIRDIANEVNLSLNAFAFVDDQSVERDEVFQILPDVRCYDADKASELVSVLGLTNLPITDESRERRRRYQVEHTRQSSEAAFEGSPVEFLATLGMVMTISPASEDDLDRAQELTVRTNQLNSTGRTYSREQLAAIAQSDNHRLLIASLEDKYGSYGRIGLALVETGKTRWTLKLLLMSCRVMSRGVGTILLEYIMREARHAGVGFGAHFVRTPQNRIMLITFRFAGFREATDEPGLLEHSLTEINDPPAHLRLVVNPWPSTGGR
ncbi:HAD-IIIC family phosphatase [Mesorhizobium sp. M0772]|uniref:HAD-IIIC family phosphatase n=1 Tax=Mesorhizobium sp. M0772 TaxID=2956998 RepID=UPI003338D152